MFGRKLRINADAIYAAFAAQAGGHDAMVEIVTEYAENFRVYGLPRENAERMLYLWRTEGIRRNLSLAEFIEQMYDGYLAMEMPRL